MKTKYGLIYKEKRIKPDGSILYYYKAISKPDRYGTKKRSMFKEYNDAENFLKKVFEEINSGTNIRASEQSFIWFMKDFNKLPSQKKLSRRTIDEKKYKQNRILKYFPKNIKVKDIDYWLLQRYMNELAEQFAPDTVKQYRDIINQVLKHAQNYNAIINIPNVEIPSIINKQKDRIKNKDMKSFLNTFDHRLKPAFWILAYSGLRTGELFALRWKDIHLDTGRIDVNGAITKLDDGSYGRDSTKSKRNRITYIFNKDAIDILRTWYDTQTIEFRKLGKKHNEETYVFTKLNGKHYHDGTTLRESIIKHCKFLGIEKFTNHSLRHNFASHLAEIGKPIHYVQYILGHADARTTQDIYVHVDMEKISQDIDDLQIS